MKSDQKHTKGVFRPTSSSIFWRTIQVLSSDKIYVGCGRRRGKKPTGSLLRFREYCMQSHSRAKRFRWQFRMTKSAEQSTQLILGSKKMRFASITIAALFIKAASATTEAEIDDRGFTPRRNRFLFLGTKGDNPICPVGMSYSTACVDFGEQPKVCCRPNQLSDRDDRCCRLGTAPLQAGEPCRRPCSDPPRQK